MRSTELFFTILCDSLFFKSSTYIHCSVICLLCCVLTDICNADLCWLCKQIFHSRSRDTSNLKMVRYADSYVHKVLMMRKYLAKKNAHISQSSSWHDDIKLRQYLFDDHVICTALSPAWADSLWCCICVNMYLRHCFVVHVLDFVEFSKVDIICLYCLLYDCQSLFIENSSLRLFYGFTDISKSSFTQAIWHMLMDVYETFSHDKASWQ